MSKFFKLLLITIVLLLGLTINNNNVNAADTGCCPASGGACVTKASCLTNTETVCDPTLARDPRCDVKIPVPGEVKITNFGRLFSGAVSFLLLIAFILALFYLILGGISWLTSGGDKANIETARNKIIAAIIGYFWGWWLQNSHVVLTLLLSYT
ncbi:hypothetical protein HYT02_01150 [Candidatus Gottesmanbacteria bacterium]|nr:hypothetical protein [Candidatus Gottesmanbacteria bacterium]